MSETVVCAACGAESPAGFRFCGQCAAPLAAVPVVAEERKVVTTLFCDLVGFTAMSEAADPEDVAAVVRQYHAAARKVIELHGGTVEKFIGDAVVGVFGVPAVHEDDPERAVRAGLRLVLAVEGMTRTDGAPLEVRVGVDTGEALVRLDVDPASGRGLLTGDAVNTAARLQAAAPPMGVVAGEATHELTQRAIVYEQLPPVAAKGKAEPVAAWLARAPVARGAARMDRAVLSPLVGREAELARVTSVFEGAVASSEPRFALLVGEPGIGKSRLIAELAEVVDRRPELVAWREGRCLPYGENVTFSALAEIVRAHAGIPDAADEAATRSRLEAALPDSEDRAWLLNRLGALLGLEAPAGTREENFAGWTRFLKTAAASRPTVLVFEDLHWADEALLAFLDYFASHVADVPVIVLACTRPELFERDPAFTRESPRLERVDLKPLSRAETASLVDAVLSETGSRAGAEIAARCGGNPFYAEQSARYLTDTAHATVLPGSVQAVIAARLDALPAARKELVGDAAVIGAVFWDGALTEIAEREPADVRQAVDDLVSRQLFRRVRSPTTALTGVHEIAFVHALARDVAYRQLPRAVRARKHAATARWLEQKAAARPEDLAETLAHHYVTALGLARACGEHGLEATLIDPAVRYLTASGDRVFNADLGAAERYYRDALDIAPAGAAGRAALQARLGEVVLWGGRDAEAADLLEEAALRLRAAGDVRRSAVALVCLARARENVAGSAALGGYFRDALALLDDDGPSPELVRVLVEWGRLKANLDEPELGLAAFESALEAARRIGAPVPALALNLRGIVRRDLGLPGYVTDFRRSLELAQEQGLGVDLGRVWGNYAAFLGQQEGPGRALEEQARALAFLKSRGLASLVDSEIPRHVESLLYAGRWAEAVAEACALESAADVNVPASTLFLVTVMRLLVQSWQGVPAEGGCEGRSLSDASRDGSFDVDVAFGSLIAELVSVWSSPHQATALLERMVATMTPGIAVWCAGLMPDAGRLALRGAAPELAERLLGCVQGPLPVAELARQSLTALLAEAHGELEAATAGFADAAARWHEFGVPYEEAHALFGQGRCLVALGRAPEAAAPLKAAREIFARLGARPALAETDEWLAGSGISHIADDGGAP